MTNRERIHLLTLLCTAALHPLVLAFDSSSVRIPNLFKSNRVNAFTRVHELFRPPHLRHAMASTVGAVFVALVLAACATGSGTSGGDQPPASASCCNSFSEMKYATLKLDTEASAELRKGSPVYEFLEGRSYYGAFALPPRVGPTKIAFKTFVGGFALPYATVVHPYFVLLDESKSEVSLAPNPPVFPGTDFFLGLFFKGELDVPPNAAYVIVYTSSRPVTSWTVYSENGIAWPAEQSMTGNLRIVVRSK
jgi:hypothetical protein